MGAGKKKGRGKHTVKQKQKGLYSDPYVQKRRRSVGPLTPHQGKTVEGTCLGGYVVVRSLDLGEVSTC